MKWINSDHFTDVCYHAGCVYAAPWHDPTIQVYDQDTWNNIRTITACKSDGKHDLHTVRVTSCGITVASLNNHCIHVLDDRDTLQQTHGQLGDAVGEFDGPRLCSVASDGSMLVADEGNHRYQIFHDGKWRVLPLQPQPQWPVGAVVTQHALYTVHRDGKALTMHRVK